VAKTEQKLRVTQGKSRVLADRVQDRAGTRNALCWRLVSEKNAKMSSAILDNGEEGSREAIDNRG
jgi:hypothetical protein